VTISSLLSATCDVEGITHLASFDFDATTLGTIIACLPDGLKAEAEEALSRAPFQVQVDFMIEAEPRYSHGSADPWGR